MQDHVVKLPRYLAADFGRSGEQVAEAERAGADRIHGKVQRVSQMISQINPTCELNVDGGIDEVSAPHVVSAGANVLVAGSSVFNANQTITAAMDALRVSTTPVVQ